MTENSQIPDRLVMDRWDGEQALSLHKVAKILVYSKWPLVKTAKCKDLRHLSAFL